MKESELRIQRLKAGDWSFGCDGTHHGTGAKGCPKRRHHHHDAFCQHPTLFELRKAGINPAEFKVKSRR